MVARFHYDEIIYRQLLEDQLPTTEQEAVSTHIEGCDVCQAKLESLSEANITWEDVRRCLKEDDCEVGADASPDTAGRLSFLTASELPGSLGRFGRYEIEAILGSGGMGVVLRGFDPALNRHSAIKVLAPELATNAAAR